MSWACLIASLLVAAPGDSDPRVPPSSEEDATNDAPTVPREPWRHALVYESVLYGRLNPLGLEERFWIGYQARLYRREGKLYDGSRIAVFGSAILSPAMTRLGGTIEVTPLSILRVRATYGFLQYFSTFEYLQSFSSPHDDFSDQALDEGRNAGENYAGSGGQLELAVRLQFKAWRIALRSETTGLYSHMDLRDQDATFFSPNFDVLMPDDGWVLLNDSDLLYVHEFERKGTLIAGVRNTLTKSFYPRDAYAAEDEPVDPIGVMDRLGPLLAYTIYDRPERRFDKPTVILLSQWHILHPWRAGRVEVTDDSGVTRTRGSSAAIPTFVLGFAFAGELVGR